MFHSAGRFEETILGVVGQLQFEVFEYRMKGEYGVDIMLQRMPFQFARWIVDDKIDPIQVPNQLYAGEGQEGQLCGTVRK